jgi:hypothetical protein
MTVIIAVGCAGGRMVNKIISAGRIEAEYLRLDPHDARHECIMMNIGQGCSMATLCTQ